MIRKTLNALRHRGQFEASLDAELQHHIELRTADLVRTGLTPADAARRARIELGSQERYKDEARAAFGLRLFDDLRQDIRYALRTLRRSPGFTATAVLSMALGISANTTVFSIVNSVLLRPLPVRAPEQLHFVNNGTNTSYSYPTYRDLRDRAETIDGAILTRVARMSIGDERSAQKVWGYLASGNYFDVLGIQAAAGQFFHPEHEKGGAGASPYAVLSYDLWQTRYRGDRNIVGSSIRVNARPYTVLGVAPQGFRGTESALDAALWVPIMMQAQIEGSSWLENRGSQNSFVTVRAKPGVAREAVQADLGRILDDLAREHPESERGNHAILSKPGWFGTTLRGPVEQFSTGVLFLGALVLLASCVNLAALLGARASDRLREIALRVSIGAGRGRIVRQLLTESVVLTTLAGATGAALGWLLLRNLTAWRPPVDLPLNLDVHPDLLVLAFSAGISILTGVLAGLAPALQAWRIDPQQALKGAPSRTRRWSVRDLSLYAQTTVCCLLVVCSLVAARGLSSVFRARPGMNPDGVSVLAFDPTLAGYSTPDALRFQRRALDAVRQIPGVTVAAYAKSIPLDTDQSNTAVFREDAAEPRRLEDGVRVGYYNVSPGYFRTMGTRLVAGRDYVWNEPENVRVAIVNETFARRMFGTAQAVGRRFRYFGGPPVEVIGIAEDGKYFTFSEDPRPIIFQRVTRSTETETALVVRSNRDETQVAAEMAQAVRKLDAAMPLYGTGSMREHMALALLPAQIALVVLGAFGVLAIMLAVTGIYGLASYSVSRRVREIGIRMAIGARPGQVLGTVLGRLGIVVTLGCITGIALGLTSGTILSAVVYQATPRDPVTLALVGLVMSTVALAAAAGPIRRAISIEPVRALHQD